MSPTTGGVALSPQAREVLGNLADALIPAGAELPSASDVGVASKLVDRVLAVRPDLHPAIIAILERATGADPASEVARLRAAEPANFDVLTFVIEGAYYLSRRVRKILGHPVPTRRYPYPDEVEYYLDGILEPVIERGPIYRRVPDGLTAPDPKEKL